jgi:hypothetical protein
MWQKFEDWLEKKEDVLNIIFLWIIPAIVGVVLATFGFLENGFLGALAGFIRGVLFTYLAYVPIDLIHHFLSDRDNRESVIGIIIWILICSVFSFIFWFITNY